MKSPTFMKQGFLGLFWWEESNNKALFAKLLQHRKLCTSSTFWSVLVSKNLVLRSRVSRICHTVSIVPFRLHLQSYELLRPVRFDARFDAHSVNFNDFAASTQVCNYNSVNCILCNHFRCYVWPPKVVLLVYMWAPRYNAESPYMGKINWSS